MYLFALESDKGKRVDYWFLYFFSLYMVVNLRDIINLKTHFLKLFFFSGGESTIPQLKRVNYTMSPTFWSYNNENPVCLRNEEIVCDNTQNVYKNFST